MKLISTTFQNFLSYGSTPTTINFEHSGTTMITGENLDHTEHGVGSNGVGKSVIINAIVYGFYDKPVSEISKDNLINNINGKNMMVSNVFEVNNEIYTISRYRKYKPGGNYVTLFKNGKDITPDSINNTNTLIERIIDIPYEIFVRAAVFSATNIAFLDLKSRDQSDIMEELLGLTRLTNKSDVLKVEIKESETSIRIEESRIDQLNNECHRLISQLHSTQLKANGWLDKRDADIEKNQTLLNELKKIDTTTQLALLLQVQDLNKAVDQYQREINTLSTQINQHKSKITKLKNEQTSLLTSKCPYCDQKLHNADEKVQEVEEQLEKINVQLDNDIKLQAEIIIDVEDITEAIDDIQPNIGPHSKGELLQIETKINNYVEKINDLSSSENVFLETLREIIEIPINGDTTLLEILSDLNLPSDIIKLMEQIDDDFNFITNTEYLNEIHSKVEHQKFLLKLLTKKDSFIRKNLINTTIPFLNNRLSVHLSDIGLPHLVEFTTEMTVNISQFGKTLEFGNLSNGQRSRVNVALSFAFRDVLQQLHGPINICVLDEVLDIGLDSIGIKNAAQMIKQKASNEQISMYIISHKNELDNIFDKQLMITFEHGFSNIKNEQNTNTTD